MASTTLRLPRRRFLQTAAAVAAPYVIPAGVLGAGGEPSASERITTALIGSGSRGQQIIVGGDVVLAVCDVDARSRMKSKAKIDAASGRSGCAAYHDFRDVLARDDIDAVVVATPDHWHVPIAAAAIKAGKAVYVEKPLSLTIREGRELVNLVDRYGTILQVGSQQRSVEFEKFGLACELVRNGRIGELQKIKVNIQTRPGSSEPWSPQSVPKGFDYDMWLGPPPWAPYHPKRCHYNFRFNSDYSGGDITNWGAHHLDIAQWALGADDSGPVEIVGHGKQNTTGLYDAFYDLQVDFTYASGVTVELSSNDGGSGGVRLEGSEGWIYVSREGMDAEPKSLLTSRIGPDELQLVPRGERSSHMGNWLNCVRAQNPQRLNAPAEIGHRSATVCHLAILAMELSGKLQWDPAAEQFVDDDQANRCRMRPARAPWQT